MPKKRYKPEEIVAKLCQVVSFFLHASRPLIPKESRLSGPKSESIAIRSASASFLREMISALLSLICFWIQTMSSDPGNCTRRSKNSAGRIAG